MNQSFHTYTEILPLVVTRTVNNSNFPLTQSNFCFPADHFYTILPLITAVNHVEKKKQNKAKQNNNKKNSVVKSKTLRKQNKKKQSKQELLVSILCFYFFGTPVQIQCPSQVINQALLLIIRFSKY